MGNLNPLCCHYFNESKQNSLKIMQSKTERKDSKNIEKYVSSYDIDFGILADFELKNCPTLYNMGELNHEGFLYLCGGSDKETGGTYFLRYNPISNKLDHLVNSRLYHRNPTLCIAKNYLYAIGGEDKLVERYDFKLNTWEEIPQLKLERSESTAFYCEEDENLYLFGGFIKFNNSNTDIVVRIKVGERANEYSWEECFLQLSSNHASLLKKSMMGIIPLNQNEILLVGGDTYLKQEYNPSNQVVKVNIKEETVTPEEFQLKKVATFRSKGCVNLINNKYAFLIDEKYKIHKFSFMENFFVE